MRQERRWGRFHQQMPPVGLLVSLMLCGCASTPLAQRPPSQAAYGAYLRGLMLERSSRLSDALEEYRLALAHDSRSPLLHVHVGATYVKLGQMDRAMQEFSKAMALDPNQADALRWIAMLHASQGELEPATAAYEHLLIVEPDDQFVMSTLVDLYVLQDQLPKAIALSQRLIAEFGSTSQLHFNLGILQGRSGHFDEALEELSRALELDPNSLDARVALGLTYELSGQPDRAAAHYEEAIRRNPLNSKLYFHAARAHLNAKQYAEAALNYQSALDLAPQDLEAVMGLVRVWLAQSKYDEAATFLGKKLEELGHPPELYVALGLVYREAKHAEEAMRAFERAIDLKNDYAQAHFYLAAQLDQLGRRELARESLHRTLQLDPNHPDALNYLGYLDAEEGTNLNEARTLVERALQFDPDNGAYMDSLGWVYFKMGKLDEAIAELEHAATLLDSDPVIFEHLGDAYFKRREFDQARRNWQKALELDPEQDNIKAKLHQLPLPEVTIKTP